MKIKNKELKTPILFIIFNRPDTTQKVFDEIKKVKPQRLFVAADGPRNDNEVIVCDQARSIIKKIDWDCEVKTLFQEKNLGCKIGVSTAINWFFDHVEEGIILEDDCLPDSTFFIFCETMLNKYRDNEKVMHIGGVNFIDQFEQSYYFSRNTYVWGWATWKRAWKFYDIKMKNFSYFIKNKKINKLFDKNIIRLYWLLIFFQVFNNEVDTWDYQWTFSVWDNDGICIIPGVNLVSNIGFDERATHTKLSDNKLSKLPINQINDIFFLNSVKVDKYNDLKLFEIVSGLKFGFNLRLIKFILKSTIIYFVLKLKYMKSRKC